MVRINLLPDRRQAKGVAVMDPAQFWILGLLGAVLVQIVLLIVVYSFKKDELKVVASENARIKEQVDKISQDLQKHDEVKAKLKELRDREDAIGKLQTGRSGPTNVLLELSRILTSGRGPTTDADRLVQLARDNPTAVPNPNWDPKRVWIVQYTELERNVRFAALAKDPDDVSEFQKRLILSDHFQDVSLLPGGKVYDNYSKQDLVRFELTAKVKY